MRNEDLQLFVRQLNECLQTTGNALWAESVCCLYRSHTGAGVLLTNRAGEAVAQAVSEKEGDGSAAGKTGGNTNSALLTLFAYTNGTPIGTLTLSRSGEFDGNEKTAAEVMLGLFTVLLVQIEERMTRERKRRQRGVRDVINSLSYSELMAATRVIKMLGGEEGVLVAGRVADALKIARSVVASTLRKLEGAGMIETRSLGMKGTYIKVKDGLLAGELGKIG